MLRIRYHWCSILLLIGIWKIIQLVYGLYVACIVSRVGIKELQRFNEPKAQLFAIIFPIFVFVVASVPLLFKDNDHETYFVLFANALPRLLSIYKKKKINIKFLQKKLYENN